MKGIGEYIECTFFTMWLYKFCLNESNWICGVNWMSQIYFTWRCSGASYFATPFRSVIHSLIFIIQFFLKYRFEKGIKNFSLIPAIDLGFQSWHFENSIGKRNQTTKALPWSITSTRPRATRQLLATPHVNISVEDRIELHVRQRRHREQCTRCQAATCANLKSSAAKVVGPYRRIHLKPRLFDFYLISPWVVFYFDPPPFALSPSCFSWPVSQRLSVLILICVEHLLQLLWIVNRLINAIKLVNKNRERMIRIHSHWAEGENVILCISS